MNNVFVFAAHNTIAALVLAVFVYGVTRVWRNPPAAHVLWLLVLLRLVAPPVVRVDWPAIRLPSLTDARGRFVTDTSQIDGPAPGRSQSVDGPMLSTSAEASVTRVQEHGFAAGLWSFWNRGRDLLFWLWVGGAVLCGLVAVTRMMRFERLLRGTLPAPERLRRLALEVSGTMGVRRSFDVRCVESVAVPFVWWAGGRPTIVLPLQLCRQFDEQQVAMILAHEFAHLRRRDHWVRGVELLIASVYWWNPLAWAVRRRIHHAEDLCCDAWVRWAFPDGTQCYAEAVLKMAESLNASHGSARLLPASPFVQSLSLKARIEMILESRFAPSVSRRSLCAVALVALFVLPAFMRTTETQARAGSNDEAPAATVPMPDSTARSEFPYVLHFEQGATRFLDGDDITIVEVRGTADTFTPGNIYWIKGTYSLASCDRAILLASITVTDWFEITSFPLDLTVSSDHVIPGEATDGVPGHATGAELKVQRQTVDRGRGTFTLFLPMTHKGLPHVSFYPVETGEGFGGNYFGTGESVLKHWWDSGEVD
jgi:beta-lactamase regulating signal transducer with metallopeptidase domain